MSNNEIVNKIQELLDDYVVNSRTIASAEAISLVTEAMWNEAKNGRILTVERHAELYDHLSEMVEIRILAFDDNRNSYRSNMRIDLENLSNSRSDMSKILEYVVCRFVEKTELEVNVMAKNSKPNEIFD